MPAPVLVVCDRCRAEGLAGEDPFEAFGDLLDFDPVPRRKTRADGWDWEVQRAFIAALSLTGSDRQAARAVGKAQFGVTQLLSSPGSEGFAAARDEALAIAADERSRRLAEGVRAVAAEQSGWKPAAPPWSKARTRAPSDEPAALPPPSRGKGPPEDGRTKEQVLDSILLKYWHKLRSERTARLEGNIAAADFYVRQLTMIEVMMDLLGDGLFELLRDFRHRGFHLNEIAATPGSVLLDRIRQMHWQDCGEPARPGAPPADGLVDQGGFLTQRDESWRGPGTVADMNAWFRERDSEHRAAAEEQVAWEARARAEAAAWAKRVAEEEANKLSDNSGDGEGGAPDEGG